MIRIQEEDFDIGAELSALTAARTDIGAVDHLHRPGAWASERRASLRA